MKLRICMIAPVSTSAYNSRLLEALQPVIPPDVEVDVRNLAEGSPHIENRLNWLENGMPVVRLAQQVENEGFDGIWLSDFDMCGVEEAREVVDIPIIGGFPPAAFTALALSQRFSIVTILDSTLAMQREHILEYGLSDSFASIRPINVPVKQLSDIELVISKVTETGWACVRDDGAQALLLGCTGFVDVAQVASRRISELAGAYVPVIDPNQAGFSFLLSLVRMGIRPSRLTYSKAVLD